MNARKAFLVALLGCLAFASMAGQGTSRQWYFLSINGQRVGYGWQERRASGAAQIETQVLRVYVSQLRHVSVVETTTEFERDARGRPKSIRVAQTHGVDRRGWRGAIAADGRSMRVTTTGSKTTLQHANRIREPGPLQLSPPTTPRQSVRLAKERTKAIDSSNSRPRNDKASPGEVRRGLEGALPRDSQ